MVAYIQIDKDKEFYNVNGFVAYTGFKALGFEVKKFHDVDEIASNDPEIIIVGGISNVRKRLSNLGIEQGGEELEYPSELQAYFNRKIWSSNLKAVMEDDNQRNIFLKPKETKTFNGKVIKEFKDFIGLNVSEEVEVWCAEVVELKTEWRCFVRYAELLDVRYYKGVWDSKLDVDLVKKAITDFKSAPAAYCLDFGVDEKGKYYLVEVNDGHSLGSYGMGAVSYAKFLSARWAELTNTKDYLQF
jgi:hypothetical protein